MSGVVTVPDAELAQSFCTDKAKGQDRALSVLPTGGVGRRSERGLDSIGAGRLFLLSLGG